MPDFLKFITYLLAIYGALMLIFSILGTIRARLDLRDSQFKLVLIVKNSGEYIEFIIRDIIRRIVADRTVPLDKFTVIDMDSSDETPAILGKLHKDFEMIELLTEKEKDKAFSNF